MKINLKLIGLLFGILVLFNSCMEENEYPYGKATPTGVSTAVFVNDAYVFEFPKLDNSELPSDGEFEVTVKLIGAPLGTEGTVGFEVLDSSTAIVGEHFDFVGTGNSLTVAANSFNGTLGITAYNGFPYDAITGESVNGGMPLDSTLYLYLKLNTTGSISAYGTTGDIVTIEINEFNFCPYDVYDLEGSYTGLGEVSVRGFTYSADIDIVVPADQAGPVYDIQFSTLWENGPGDIWGEVWTDGPIDFIDATFDMSDKLYPSVTIPNVYLGTTDDLYPYWVMDNGGTSFLDYCAKTFTLRYVIDYAGDPGSLVDICYVVFDYDTKKATSSTVTTYNYDLTKFYK